MMAIRKEFRVTDEDERIINRAIALVYSPFDEEREEARAALHRIFRKTRGLEEAIALVTADLAKANAEIGRLQGPLAPAEYPVDAPSWESTWGRG